MRCLSPTCLLSLLHWSIPWWKLLQKSYFTLHSFHVDRLCLACAFFCCKHCWTPI